MRSLPGDVAFPCAPREIPRRRPVAPTTRPPAHATGHEARHTLELPNGNRTSDKELARTANDEGRVVVSKDDGFRYGHLPRRTPQWLLLIATGNIANSDLEALLAQHLGMIVQAFTEVDFVELTPDSIVSHPLPG